MGGLEGTWWAPVSSAWWGAGLGVLVVAGLQVALGILEGLAGPGEDYTAMASEPPGRFASLLALGAIAGCAAHLWWWPQVWLHVPGPGPPDSPDPSEPTGRR